MGIDNSGNMLKLQAWVAQSYSCGSAEIKLLPLGNDASFRKYYRFIVNNQTFIAVDSPPATEKNIAFVAIQYILKNSGVNVPNIIKYHEQEGFFILEDLNDGILLPILKKNNCSPTPLYGQCVEELFKIQQYNYLDNKKLLSDNYQYSLPFYDQKLLNNEMELFREWFIDKYLNLPISVLDHELLDIIFNIMVVNAYAQPQVLVHRDYHSRNLMRVTTTGNSSSRIYVIDFQDAVLGPVTYDLVSLFRDCYIAWPISLVKHWVEDYFVQAKIYKILLNDLDFEQFWTWFLQMTLQRNFKTIGIFARLHIRDNKSGYLDDIPRTLGYAIEVTEILSQQTTNPDCSQYVKLNKLFSETIKPALELLRAKKTRNSDIISAVGSFSE